MTYTLLLLALAAPAPRPVRPPTEADLEGVYRLDWHGSAYVLALEGHGNYCLFCPGTGARLWWGTWRLDVGLVRIEEWGAWDPRDPGRPPAFRWEMRVGKAKGGGLESKTPGIRIRRAR